MTLLADKLGFLNEKNTEQMEKTNLPETTTFSKVYFDKTEKLYKNAHKHIVKTKSISSKKLCYKFFVYQINLTILFVKLLFKKPHE